MKYIHFLLCLLLGIGVQAQIKIGDNPQNIDPSSILELESNTRVLVITRVNTAEMNALTPLEGAMVYNTDVGCLHYYTGTAWRNSCDALAGSINFNSDDGSIIIETEEGNAYNLKVGQIRGSSIIDNTILGSKLWNGSITSSKLGGDSVTNLHLQDNIVGKAELQENAVGSLEIIDGEISPEDIASGGIDQLLSTDDTGAVVWMSKSDLGVTQADEITITGNGTTTDPIKVADEGINTLQLANAAVTNNKIAIDAIGTPQLVNFSVTNAKLDKANIPLSGFGAAAASVDLGSNKLINVLDPTDPQDAATKAYVDAMGGGGGGGTDDQTATEVPYDNTTSLLTATNTQAAIDELVAAGGGGSITAEDVTVIATPVNYTITATNVEAHLGGIDAALARGTISTSIRAVDTPTVTILDNDHTVILNNGVTQVNLPAANATNIGRIYIIKNASSIAPSISPYINSIGSQPPFLTIPLGVLQLQSDGINWQQIN